MKPFSFVHTADLHLDSPFVGLRDVDEKVVREIREATFHTFDRIIDLCLERNADFLLVAGDIYDSRDRSLRAQLRFRDGLRRLSDEGISSFVVHGNHDPLDSWAATLKWPERAHIFGGNAVTAKRVERDGQTIALVYGISYPTQEVRANLATKFRRHDEGKFAIGLLHCNVGVDTGHEPYAPCSMKDLASAGMDYWALGHVHNTCVLSSEEPMIVYPGNPQGRTPLEVGARGCYFVEVRETGRARAEFVPVDSVRWQWKSIPVEELGTDEAVVSAVERACQEMREDAGGRPVVGRISLSGRGPAYASLARPNFVAGLVERLHETEGSDDPFVWIERVEVNVRPPLDLEARRAGQDFVADLLNLIEGYRKDPERITFLREHLKPLFQARRAHRHLEPPSDAQLRGWLEAAEAKCADLLTAEED